MAQSASCGPPTLLSRVKFARSPNFVQLPLPVALSTSEVVHHTEQRFPIFIPPFLPRFVLSCAVFSFFLFLLACPHIAQEILLAHCSPTTPARPPLPKTSRWPSTTRQQAATKSPPLCRATPTTCFSLTLLAIRGFSSTRPMEEVARLLPMMEAPSSPPAPPPPPG